MTQDSIKQCSSGWIGISVPEDAKRFEIQPWLTGQTLFIYMDDPPEPDFYQRLPKGDWQILLDTSTVTEEDAKRAVANPEYGFFLNYLKGNMDTYACKTAMESFATYKTFFGIDEGRWILLENKNYRQ